MNLKAFVFCVGIAAASAMMTGPAAAQWGPYGSYRYGPVPVPAYAVAPALRAQGLRPVTQPLQTGRYIVVRALDPRRVLDRGYSITRDTEGRVVKQATALTAGAVVDTELANGRFTSRVEAITEDSGE